MNADLLSNEYFAILANPSFWVAVLRIATPLILGTLGVLLCERAGILNLGIEGIMVAGAFTGWLAVHGGAPLWAGVLVAALTGALLGLYGAILIARPTAWLVSNTFAIPEVSPHQVVEVADHRATRLYCYRLASSNPASAGMHFP